jgi:hypothetical protein
VLKFAVSRNPIIEWRRDTARRVMARTQAHRDADSKYYAEKVKQITVKFSPSLFRKLEAKAIASSLTVVEYLRLLAEKDCS